MINCLQFIQQKYKQTSFKHEIQTNLSFLFQAQFLRLTIHTFLRICFYSGTNAKLTILEKDIHKICLNASVLPHMINHVSS